MPGRFTLLLLFFIACADAAINEKIAKTESQLHTKTVQEKEISRRIGQLANEITEQSNRLVSLKQEITASEANIKQLKSKLNLKSDKLRKLQALYKKLKKREDEVNRKLSALLSREIVLDMLSGSDDTDNVSTLFEQNSEQLVQKEVLRNYRKLLKDKFAKTKREFEKIQKNRMLIQTELEKTHSRLNKLEKAQNRLKRLQNLQAATVQNLRKKKKTYLAKLARIRKERQNLSQTLNKLHITQKKLEQTRIKPATTGNIKVRQIGSSYQKGSIARYRGKKTIAPLKAYSVEQKFGTFVDPIYKIKIFNESVTLKPKTPNAVVRNILPGRVVYASKVPMLDYVVIVEHPGKLHTIYAHLSKLAPTIKVGRKIKKAYALGRVDNALKFEVTQQEKHINPMELIR